MHDHIAIVHDQPTVASLTFHLSLFFVFFPHILNDSLSQGIQHAVAGAVAQDKVIGKGCDVLEIE